MPLTTPPTLHRGRHRATAWNAWAHPLPLVLLGPLLAGCPGPEVGILPLQPTDPALAPCGPFFDGAAGGGKVLTAPLGPASGSVCYEDGAAELIAAEDLALEGHSAVSPAATLRLDRPVGVRGVEITLPLRLSQIPAALREGGQVYAAAGRAQLRVVGRFGKAPAHLLMAGNPQVAWTPSGGQLRFRLPPHELAPRSATGALGEVGTFQIAVRKQAGQRERRRFTYRVLGGVSMGGIGASMNFFRDPERFDAVGVMGADPGPDLTYAQGYIRDYLFGGFCTAEDEQQGRGRLGALCPTTRQALRGQGEITGDFERMPVQQGEGIGLTLRRGLFLRANRDLVRALGNWAYYNPADPYLPPAVPASVLGQAPAEACQKPVVIRGALRGGAAPFYDGRFNPEGKFDVISFCDAEADGKPGVFDGQKAGADPAQILLAVDLNGNGRRDAGEPVLMQTGEPYRDLGPDGKASRDEPGYDAVQNPDPAGDDYHYLKNPGGTEGNWRWDRGEPFDDVGIDGVAKKGCAAGAAEGCFDHGEGNGKWDVNPGLLRWLAHDPRTLLEQLPQAQLDRVDLYYDAGIRDFFNAHVATNTLLGALAVRGKGLTVFDTFPALAGLPPGSEGRFEARAVDLKRLGRRVYVRYGNPLVSDADAAQTGDGRHVGTATQVVNRALLLFSFLLSRWPDPDLEPYEADDDRLYPKGLVLKQKNGRETPYGLVLPPGYFAEENQGRRYPIAYFGHGYGQDPEDLTQIGSIIHLFMGEKDEKKRLPKAILVFLDGRCRPGGEVPRGPLPMTGDLCEGGGFYTDHTQGTYQGATLIQELDDYLRRTYRVREPAEFEVPVE